MMNNLYSIKIYNPIEISNLAIQILKSVFLKTTFMVATPLINLFYYYLFLHKAFQLIEKVFVLFIIKRNSAKIYSK